MSPYFNFLWHNHQSKHSNPPFFALSNLSCAVLSLCWPTIGRGCGAFFCAHIWDFVGSWPIFLSAGLSLRLHQTGNEITKLDIRLFATESNDP
jgi:hypothetical protein